MHLGMGLGGDAGLLCLRQMELDYDELCMEWKGKARLYVSLQQHISGVQCYNFMWSSLLTQTEHRDCFSLAGASWYGMGDGFTWPLNRPAGEDQPFSVNRTAYVTGAGPFGRILRRTWYSSAGAVIHVPYELPLFVSVDSEEPGSLCLSVAHQEQYYRVPPEEYLELNYSVCTADTLKLVRNEVGPRGRKMGENEPQGTTPLLAFFRPDPFTDFSQAGLFKFLEKLDTVYGKSRRPEYVVLDQSW
ncbi:unnamed protein product, partial [Darwinula stevensoni]